MDLCSSFGKSLISNEAEVKPRELVYNPDMDLVLLSGNSIENKEWIEEVDRVVSLGFNSTYVQYYDHWEKGGKMIDFDVEMEKLVDAVESLDKYSIFAKSAGVLLALRGIAEKKINPAKCIFAGTAIYFGLRLKLDVKKWLKACTVPALFVQKELDPAISFKDLEVFVRTAGMKNYKMQEIPGHNHHYGDTGELKKFITEFILK